MDWVRVDEKNISEVEGGTETGNRGTVNTDMDTDRKATMQLAK